MHGSRGTVFVFSSRTLRHCWLRSSKVHWPIGIWKVNPWPMGFEIAEANNSDHNSGERELNGWCLRFDLVSWLIHDLKIVVGCGHAHHRFTIIWSFLHFQTEPQGLSSLAQTKSTHMTNPPKDTHTHHSQWPLPWWHSHKKHQMAFASWDLQPSASILLAGRWSLASGDPATLRGSGSSHRNFTVGCRHTRKNVERLPRYTFAFVQTRSTELFVFSGKNSLFSVPSWFVGFAAPITPLLETAGDIHPSHPHSRPVRKKRNVAERSPKNQQWGEITSAAPWVWKLSWETWNSEKLVVWENSHDRSENYSTMIGTSSVHENCNCRNYHDPYYKSHDWLSWSHPLQYK